jgi:hypothetical protein
MPRTRAQLIASVVASGGVPFYWLKRIDSWFITSRAQFVRLLPSNDGDGGPTAA